MAQNYPEGPCYITQEEQTLIELFRLMNEDEQQRLLELLKIGNAESSDTNLSL